MFLVFNFKCKISYFYNILNSLLPNHKYDTRNVINFNSPLNKLIRFHRFFLFNGIQLYNALLLYVKNLQIVIIFKKNLKKRLVSFLKFNLINGYMYNMGQNFLNFFI